ncbi:MAG: tRNA (adenosine(37)-N6)-threonylcarbamoyltransferase complex dimerization subunit type 1 TsaB [Planctomycetota bacterium]
MTETGVVHRLATRRERVCFVLAIEASNPSIGGGGVCVARAARGGLEVIGSAALGDTARASDGVMIAVETACRHAGVDASQLGEIAVSVGPGGYTALRVATTTAKTLAFALACPIVPVPSWSVAAESVAAADRPALIAMAGKGGAAYLTAIDADGGADVLGVTAAEAVQPGMARTLVCDAHIPRPIADRCEALGMARRPIALSPDACVSCSAWYAPVAPEGIEPVYGREPDAVTQWRARQGG